MMLDDDLCPWNQPFPLRRVLNQQRGILLDKTETALLLLLRDDVTLRSTDVDFAGEREDGRCEKGSHDRDGELLFHRIRLRICEVHRGVPVAALPLKCAGA